MVHVPERRRNGRSHAERIACLHAMELAWTHVTHRVLLVDCIPDEQSMYMEYLEHAGLAPVVSCDGAAAFQHAASAPPEVVVMDLGVQPDSMLTLLQQFRADSRTRDARIVAISGHVFPKDKAEAIRAGCDVFLPKPCAPETLLAEIVRLVKRVEHHDLARPMSP
jgi:CheY-like chemotaxis protein